MLFVPTISQMLVLGILSLLLLLTAFLKNLISQVVILRSRGLVMVPVWHWYVSVGTKMEFMILLFVSIGIVYPWSVVCSAESGRRGLLFVGWLLIVPATG